MRSPTGKNSSGCGTRVFGIIWTAFSSIFLVVGLWITWRGIMGKTWQKLPCTISKFEIVDDEGKDRAFRAERAETPPTPRQSPRALAGSLRRNRSFPLKISHLRDSRKFL